jgi:hypothetical protein
MLSCTITLSIKKSLQQSFYATVIVHKNVSGVASILSTTYSSAGAAFCDPLQEHGFQLS